MFCQVAEIVPYLQTAAYASGGASRMHGWCPNVHCGKIAKRGTCDDVYDSLMSNQEVCNTKPAGISMQSSNPPTTCPRTIIAPTRMHCVYLQPTLDAYRL